MVEVKPHEETKRYAICPECGDHTSTVDHLLNTKTETMWYCDNCGSRYRLKFEDGKMFIGKTDERKDKTLVLLRHGTMWLVVEGMKFSTHRENNNEYYYNEHTCPTNYLRDVVRIIDSRNMDADPHGIFEYIGTFPWDERIKNNPTQHDIVNIFRTDLLKEK